MTSTFYDPSHADIYTSGFYCFHITCAGILPSGLEHQVYVFGRPLFSIACAPVLYLFGSIGRKLLVISSGQD